MPLSAKYQGAREAPRDHIEAVLDTRQPMLAPRMPCRCMLLERATFLTDLADALGRQPAGGKHVEI